jgi:hypothetical protein
VRRVSIVLPESKFCMGVETKSNHLDYIEYG